MEKSDQFLGRPGHHMEETSVGSSEKEKKDRPVSPRDRLTADRRDAFRTHGAPPPAQPPKGGKSRFVIAGIAAVCLLAAVAWYFLRAPAESGGSTITANNITATSATITWTTDKQLASQVEYGTTTAYGFLSKFDSVPVTSHSVSLTALTPGTTYNYHALSTDAAGQVNTSPNFTFTTTGGAASATTAAGRSAGPAVVNGVTAGNVTTSSATVTWTTDQPLTSQVEYGTTTNYGSLTAFNAQPVTSHSVPLTALAPGTTYNYAAMSTGSAAQVTTSPNFTFTTLNVSGPPVISEVTAAALSATSAKITWTTDQPSASQVEFGTTTGYGSLSAFSAPLVTTHSVTLPGLAPGKTYNYAALSVNSTGQVGTSANFTFTASAASGAPAITGVTATAVTNNSATITWTTNQASASQVEFGATPTYGSLSAYSSPLVTSHSVTLPGLAPGKTYNFAAMSANATGQVGTSANFTLTTVAGPPGITEIKVSPITGNSATITWTTDQPSTSQVKYGTTSALSSLVHRLRSYESTSALDTKLSTSHSVTLTGLSPKTGYNFEVMSKNSGGVESVSPNLKFETLAVRTEIEKIMPDSEVGYVLRRRSLASMATIFGVFAIVGVGFVNGVR